MESVVEHVVWGTMAVGLAGAGLWLLKGRRLVGVPQTSSPGEVGKSGQNGEDDERESAAMELPLIGEVSEPTRLVLGLVLIVVGYHVAAYGLPSGWFRLKVPASNWWMLAIGVALAVAGALLAERLERRR